MGHLTVFSGPERRRRWSDKERLQLLADAVASGAGVADACRRHDVSTALVYTWRRKLLDAGARQQADVPGTMLTRVFVDALMDEDAAAYTVGHPAIVIDLPRGKRLSIFAAASPVLVAAALKALR